MREVENLKVSELLSKVRRYGTEYLVMAQDQCLEAS